MDIGHLSIKKVDNFNDDSESLQVAIDFACNNTKVLKIERNYVINKSLYIKGSIQIIGIGQNMPIIKVSKDTTILFIENSINVSIENVSFYGLYEIGNSNFKNGIIKARDIVNLSLKNCFFRNSGSNAISITRGRHVSIIQCFFDTVFLSGVRFNDPGVNGVNEDINIIGCEFNNVVYYPQAGNGAIFFASAKDGIESNCKVRVENNNIESFGVGIGLDAVDNAKIRFNRLKGSGKRGEGIPFTGRNVEISYNFINDFGAAGILWWITDDKKQESVLIFHNSCWDNNTGIEVVMVSNNSIAKKLTIKENVCWSTGYGKKNQKYGFQLYRNKRNNVTGGKWSEILIEDNDFRGNTKLPFTLLNDFKKDALIKMNKK